MVYNTSSLSEPLFSHSTATASTRVTPPVEALEPPILHRAVRKKEEVVQRCQDHQQHNTITVTDSYLLPRMDDLLEAANYTQRE